MTTKSLMLALLFALLPALCVAEDTKADASKGKALYDKLCLQCHGATGAGDGPVGKSLPPAMKPADMSTGSFKYATDQEKFAELLKKGGAAVGLNPMMPPQAGVTEEDVPALWAYVQSLRK